MGVNPTSWDYLFRDMRMKHIAFYMQGLRECRSKTSVLIHANNREVQEGVLIEPNKQLFMEKALDEY